MGKHPAKPSKKKREELDELTRRKIEHLADQINQYKKEGIDLDRTIFVSNEIYDHQLKSFCNDTELKLGENLADFVWLRREIEGEHIIAKASLLEAFIRLRYGVGVPQQQPWEMSLASTILHLLPKTAREEWLGDLREAREELIAAGRNMWVIRLITIGRIVLLAWSFVSIKYHDLVSPAKKRAPRK